MNWELFYVFITWAVEVGAIISALAGIVIFISDAETGSITSRRVIVMLFVSISVAIVGAASIIGMGWY